MKFNDVKFNINEKKIEKDINQEAKEKELNFYKGKLLIYLDIIHENIYSKKIGKITLNCSSFKNLEYIQAIMNNIIVFNVILRKDNKVDYICYCEQFEENENGEIPEYQQWVNTINGKCNITFRRKK